MLGGAQMPLGVWFDIQDCFEKYLIAARRVPFRYMTRRRAPKGPGRERRDTWTALRPYPAL